MSYFDPDVTFELANSTEICPFEVSVELIDQADVIVCDYNYIFDPHVGLKTYTQEKHAIERQEGLQNCRRETPEMRDEHSGDATRSRGSGAPPSRRLNWRRPAAGPRRVSTFTSADGVMVRPAFAGFARC
ncbi:MAG: hypothetical protein ACJ74H_10705 [Thermoanaerobaculia bacterium]